MKKQRILAMALTICLLFTNFITPVFAINDGLTEIDSESSEIVLDPSNSIEVSTESNQEIAPSPDGENTPPISDEVSTIGVDDVSSQESVEETNSSVESAIGEPTPITTVESTELPNEPESEETEESSTISQNAQEQIDSEEELDEQVSSEESQEQEDSAIEPTTSESENDADDSSEEQTSEEQESSTSSNTEDDSLQGEMMPFSLVSVDRFPLTSVLVDGLFDISLFYRSSASSSYETQIYPTDNTSSSRNPTISNRETAVIAVRFENMNFINGSITEGVVYEYTLPSQLIPSLDYGESEPNPDDPTTWEKLTNVGKAEAYGYIEQAGSTYKLVITFIEGTTDGVVDIQGKYQYDATINPDAYVNSDNKIVVPFTNNKTFELKITPPATPTPEVEHWIEKTAEWMDYGSYPLNQSGSATADTLTSTGSAEDNDYNSGTDYRLIKYTVKITNPSDNDDVLVSGKVEEQLDKSLIMFYGNSNGNTNGFYATASKIKIDDQEYALQYSNSGFHYRNDDSGAIDFDFSWTNNGALDVEYASTYTTVNSFNHITFSINNLSFKTIEFSYIAQILDVKAYITTTNSVYDQFKTTSSGSILGYKNGEPETFKDTVEVSASKLRPPVPPTISQSNYVANNTSPTGKSSQSYASSIDITWNITPKGSNWIKFKDEITPSSSYVGYYCYSVPFFGGTGGSKGWEDIKIDGHSLNRRSSDYIKQYSPSDYVELYNLVGPSIIDEIPVFMATTKNNESIFVVPTIETYQEAKNNSKYSSGGELPLMQDNYGNPYKPEFYIIGLDNKSAQNGITFTVRLYLLRRPVSNYDMATNYYESHDNTQANTLGYISRPVLSSLRYDNCYTYTVNHSTTNDYRTYPLQKQITLTSDGSYHVREILDLSELRNFIGKFTSNYLSDGGIMFLVGIDLPYGFSLSRCHGYDPDSSMPSPTLDLNTSEWFDYKSNPYLEPYFPNTGSIEISFSSGTNKMTMSSSSLSVSYYGDLWKNTYRGSKILFNGLSESNFDQYAYFSYYRDIVNQADYMYIDYEIYDTNYGQNSINSSSQFSLTSFIYVFNGRSIKPIDEYIGTSIFYGAKPSKTMSISTDPKTLNQTATVQIKPASGYFGAGNYWGSYYFSGALNWHDDMKKANILVQQNGKYVTKEISDLDEHIAKFIKLRQINFNFNFGNDPGGMYNSPQPIFIQDPNSPCEIEQSLGGNYAKVKLKYYGNMYDGFDIKLLGLKNLNNYTITYILTLDLKEYLRETSQNGVFKLNLNNSLTPNYNDLWKSYYSNSPLSSASAETFVYAASPYYQLEDKGSESTNGNYINKYKAIADVGPSSQSEVYLVNQINSIEELWREGNLPQRTDIPVEDFIKYFRIRDITIKTGKRGVEDDEPTTIYTSEYTPKDKINTEPQIEIDSDWVITPVDNPAEFFKNCPVDDGQPLNGNLLAFKIEKADGSPVDSETYFEIEFEVELGKIKDDFAEGYFRDDELYHGGTFMTDLQGAIAFKFTPEDSLEEVNLIDLLSTDDDDTWVSAGESLGQDHADFLSNNTGVKYALSDTEWEFKGNTGSRGKGGSASFNELIDAMHIHAIIDGEPVADDTLNDNLCRLLYKYIKVNITDIYLKEKTEEYRIYPLEGEIDPSKWNEEDWNKEVKPSYDLEVYSYDEGRHYHYQSSEASGDAGHGYGIEELFKLSMFGLPYETDVFVDYNLDIDWQALIEEAIELGYVTASQALEYPLAQNYITGMDDEVEKESKFQVPASIMGTISKSHTSDNNNSEINWGLDVTILGNKIYNYQIKDKLTVADEDDENSNIAYDLVKISKLVINQKQEDGTLTPIADLTDLIGSEGTLNLADYVTTDLWSNATVTFEDHAGFILNFGQLEPCSLVVSYSTKVDKDEFVENGGSLQDGYTFANGAVASIPCAELEAKDEGSIDWDIPSVKKEVTEHGNTERIWTITRTPGAESTGKVKSMTIKDNLTASNEEIIPFVYFKNIKVEKVVGEDRTVIYDSTLETQPEGFDYAFNEEFNLNTKGIMSFEFTLNNFDDGEIVITYVTDIDIDAFKKSDIEDENFTFTNGIEMSQSGFDTQSTSKNTTTHIPESVDKQGRIYSSATQDRGSIIEWTVDLHLNSFISADQLAILEANGEPAIIEDVLPSGLEWMPSYNTGKGVKIVALTNSSNSWRTGSELTNDQYEISLEDDTTLTIKLFNPDTNSNVRITFQTEAIANLGFTDNSITVKANGKSEENESDRLSGVYTRQQGGVIRSNTLPKVTLEAKKFLNNEAPGEATFTFSAIELDENLQEKPNGYNFTAQNDANGDIQFSETGYLSEGTHYYKISEIPESKDAEYEGVVYNYDDNWFIVKVDVVKVVNGYSPIVKVIQAKNDISVDLLDVPEFYNGEKELQSITVTKVWNDNNNNREERPESINVQLARNGIVYSNRPDANAILNEENNWTYTWDNLAANGVYTVLENTEDENYGIYYYGVLDDGKVDGAHTSYTLTNTYIEPYGKLNINKIFSGRDLLANDLYKFTIEAETENAPMPAVTEYTLDLNSADSFKFEYGFGEIEFIDEGNYTYLIKETAGDTGGVEYSTLAYRLTISAQKIATVHGEQMITNVAKLEVSNDGESFSECAVREGFIFENTYKTTDVTFTANVEKAVEGDVPENNQKDFSFTIVANEEYDGVVMPKNTTVTITGNGTASFDKITFTKPGTYDFTINETKGSETGYTYSEDTWTLQVIVRDNLEGALVIDSSIYTLTNTNTTSETEATFTNSYTPNSTEFTVDIEKEVTGDETPDDKTFNFKVELKGGDVDGVELTDDTASITGSGKTAIGNATFTKAGTYTFQVYEVADTIPGYSFDGRIYDVEVVVVDNDGNLAVDSVTYKVNDEEQEAVKFANTYTTTDISYQPTINKVVTGDKTPDDKQFKFEIINKNSNNVEMPESLYATVTGAGKTSFDKITFTKADTYAFEIREVRGRDNGYTYSEAIIDLTIKVVDKDSLLTIDSVVYKDRDTEKETNDFAEFTNTYETTPTQYAPKVHKVITGSNQPKDVEFEFTLAYKSGNKNGYVISNPVAKHSGEGVATFGNIAFTKAGTYAFTIKETDSEIEGYTYDKTTWILEVDVVDNDSTLEVASYRYLRVADTGEQTEEKRITFTNNYKPESISYEIPVQKTLTGEDTPSAKDFVFELTDNNNPSVVTGSTSLRITGSGRGKFDPINFRKAGTYTFTVKEVDGKIDGYTYDKAVFDVEIVISDNNGKLTIDSVKYVKVLDNKKEDVEGIVFVNDYSVTPTTTALEVTKNISGTAPATAKNFTFELSADKQDGVELPENTQVTIKGTGKGSFDEITFTKAGRYEFLISEVKGTERGYIYDESTWRAVVIVEDLNSKLAATSVDYYKEGSNLVRDTAVFENLYNVKPVEYQISIVKEITGDKPSVDKEFKFDLTGEQEYMTLPEETEISITGDGTASFEPIEFTKAGQYAVTVSEKRESGNGYAYDDSVWTITISIVDNNGTLEINNVVYAKNGETSTDTVCKFVNRYDATSVNFDLPIEKLVSGDKTPENKEFTFKLSKEEDAKSVTLPKDKEITIVGNGSGMFESIKFTKVGTYTLTVEEVKGEDAGYTYDPAVWSVVLTIVDNDSQLTIDDVQFLKNGKEVHSDKCQFINEYKTTSVKYNIPVEKVIKGDETPNNVEFTFELANIGETDGVVMPENTTMTIKGAGTNTFDYVEFTKEGRYTFEVTEVKGAEEGYSYDETVWNILVDVLDNDSKLTVSVVKYMADGVENEAEQCEFVNEYKGPEVEEPEETPEPTETPAPSETPAPTETPQPGGGDSQTPSKPSGPDKDEPVKTGESINSSTRFMVLGLAAVITVGIGVYVGKKKKKK